MINKYADSSKTTLRISFDAKADVKIGNLSRGGKNRKDTKADDHDFGVDGKITPVGVFLPKDKDLFLYMVKSKTTSDCYVGATCPYGVRLLLIVVRGVSLDKVKFAKR